MKSLKSKVMASAAMLLIAAVMMTSSSFAWYTLSTQGDLSKVKVEMTSTDNVEIAVASSQPGEVALGGAGDQRTWGATAVYSDTATVLKQLCQVDDTGKVKIAQYESGSGRIKSELKDATDKTDASYDETSATPQIWKAEDGQNCCAVYDFYVRTNLKGKTLQLKDSGSSWTATDNGNKLTAKIVINGEAKGTWTGTAGTAIDITPDETGSDGYGYSHIYIYVYADGNSFMARDLDSTGTNKADFVGNFTVAQKPAS